MSKNSSYDTFPLIDISPALFDFLTTKTVDVEEVVFVVLSKFEFESFEPVNVEIHFKYSLSFVNASPRVSVFIVL